MVHIESLKFEESIYSPMGLLKSLVKVKVGVLRPVWMPGSYHVLSIATCGTQTNTEVRAHD